jgi:LysR family transcriptional regulator (chromosome initiation inhibitor)
VPELQAREQLANGLLVEICADTPIDVPLYWHHWRNGGHLLAQLTEHLRHTARHWLVPL